VLCHLTPTALKTLENAHLIGLLTIAASVDEAVTTFSSSPA
jgi:hypothetical protein